MYVVQEKLIFSQVSHSVQMVLFKGLVYRLGVSKVRESVVYDLGIESGANFRGVRQSSEVKSMVDCPSPSPAGEIATGGSGRHCLVIFRLQSYCKSDLYGVYQ